MCILFDPVIFNGLPWLGYLVRPHHEKHTFIPYFIHLSIIFCTYFTFSMLTCHLEWFPALLVTCLHKSYTSTTFCQQAHQHARLCYITQHHTAHCVHSLHYTSFTTLVPTLLVHLHHLPALNTLHCICTHCLLYFFYIYLPLCTLEYYLFILHLF